MKKIILLIATIVFQSCYTLKPDSRNLSSKDYNERQQIGNPILVKKRNPIGVSFNIITPMTAGAAMYQFVNPVVKYQDGPETKGFKPANAAIGVLGMLAVNKIADYAMGYNKPQNLSEKSIEKWIEKTKLNVSNSFISNDNYTELTIIPKSKESSFEVRNIDDVVEYKTFFYEASEINVSRIVTNAIPKLEHEDLVSLVDLYPNNKETYYAKTKYIETATNYNELWQRVKKYPEAKVETELLASNLVANGSDLSDFISKYPISNYLNKVKVYSFKQKYDYSNLNDLILINNNILALDEAIFKQYYNNNQKITENYFNALYDNEKVNSLKDITYFFTKNNWLTKLTSSNNKLEKAWNIGYNEFSNGDDLVYLLKTFNDYDWGISSYEIENFVDNKLMNITKNQVSISNYNTKRSNNEDLERFRNSPRAPFMVTTEGVVHYLIYGDLVNRSKFSLPIKVNSSSQLKLMQEGLSADAMRFVANLIIGGNIKESFKPIGILSNSYLVGYLKPNETKKIAIKYELDGSLEKGYDFGFDLFSIQYVERIKLDDHKFEILYTKENLTEQLMNKQNSWLEFVHGELPNAQMQDNLRNISYSSSQDDRDSEAEELREQYRRAEALRQMQDNANDQHSYVISSKNAKVDFKIHLDSSQENIINIYSRDNDTYDCCYRATITKYDEYSKNKRGYVIKEFTNEDRFWSSSQQSTNDNNINLNNSDFPVIVDLWYSYNKSGKTYDVEFSVLIDKGAYIEVKPDKNNLKD